MTDQHQITGRLAATIKADGAELCSLRDPAGHELMWSGAPLWPAHSPVLFPIVGQVANDQITVAGRHYPLPRHGLARRRRFEWLDRAADRCSLALQDDAETRAIFPFPFRLTLSYAIDGDTLRVDYALHNPGHAPLPASLGAHPAFRWPLYGGAQTDYRLDFAEPEPDPIHYLADGLLDPAGEPTPIQGRTLPLAPNLFDRDALILLTPRSRALRYTGPGGALEFAWHGFPNLGLWQKPGAELLCLEPWHGYASPRGWDGEFDGKPGLIHLSPGQTHHAFWTARPR